MINYFPKYFTNKAQILYFVVLVFISFMYINQIMNIEWLITGILSVFCFCRYANVLPQKWAKYSIKKFESKLFWNTLILRLIWILIYYAFTMLVWDTPWEQPPGSSIDSGGYFDTGLWVTKMLESGTIQYYWDYGTQAGFADLGYPFYLGIMNLFSDGSIMFSRLFNALFDAWAAVLLFRLAYRNFGENIGRLTGIFMMIMPLMFFYCGLTMKEALMGMLCLWFLERADLMIRERSFSFWKIVVVILLAGSIFFFRAVLAMVSVMSLFAAIVFTSGTVIGWKKRIIMGVFVVSIIGVLMGGYIMKQAEELQQQQQMVAGDANLEFRADRKGGNVLVKKISAGVFAPVIFTVPFPTMVDVPEQPIQQLLNGANYLKNILSFFVILGLVILVKTKQWRKHALILAFLCGYMAALGLSPFAHAGRFHQPTLPLELMFAAFTICNITKKQAKWFNYFLVLEFVIIIGWTWFKLAGRELVQ